MTDPEEAVKQAQKRLDTQRALWPAIRARVISLVSHVEDNHLSARIVQAIRSERP